MQTAERCAPHHAACSSLSLSAFAADPTRARTLLRPAPSAFIERPARPRLPPHLLVQPGHLHQLTSLAYSSKAPPGSARLPCRVHRPAGQPAMGNCLNAASRQRHGGLMPEEEESLSEMRRISQLLREEEEEEEEEADAEYSEDVEEAPPVAAEGLKVKIVLTRAELEWLMAQLKSGEQRLEDVLHHMHAVKQGGGWRPRLESILECPETLISL